LLQIFAFIQTIRLRLCHLKTKKASKINNDSPASLQPRQIVRELNRYIIGQEKAKRAVAVALRNRWRRQECPDNIRDEIMPFNIILIGPTGVGKTEIARRLAALADAPFIKVEASRFTEVGYVGRDVESMIRDLMDISVQRERSIELERLQESVNTAVKTELLDLAQASLPDVSRDELNLKFENAELDDLLVTMEVDEPAGGAMMQVFTPGGMEEVVSNIQDFVGDMMPKQSSSRQMELREAQSQLIQIESQRQLDNEGIIVRALERCENHGIVFIDEVDKICVSQDSVGPDVSRQGVQKDILPVIEGTTVHTKYGIVRTDHMLFISSGAFHLAKPSDLIPELQGRFPVRVEMDSLSRKDLEKILTRPENALVRQYEALFAAENVKLTITVSAVKELAKAAQKANSAAENIGARRLQGMMSLLFEEELYRLPDPKMKELEVDIEFVRNKLDGLVENEDLSRYIL
jgi:ATP-dependent HslUV protease ATP-binding subunit HslU